MINPSHETFKQLSESYTSVPLYTQFKEDYFTPIAIFEKLKSLNPKYLLESAGEHQDGGRYSYIGLLTTPEDVTSVEQLEQLIKESKMYENHSLPPFYDGYIGYIAYEEVKEMHNIPITKQSITKPFGVMYAKLTVIIDHFINEITIVYNCSADDYLFGSQMIDSAKRLIQSEFITSDFKPLNKDLKIQSNMSKLDFTSMISRAKSYIKAGDIFQVVLSQQFKAPLECPPFEVYKSVRRENPSPYLSYIEFGDITTICSSPELLIKHNNSRIETAPIAGTRAVKNDGKDHLRATELLNDEKELAEHLMLVDLGRNDIGKVSKPGTVSVDNFCQVKKYAKVMHLVSAVTGELKDEETCLTALVSCFPAGTVSGAPKKRAMEIIDELEPSPRNIYAGSIFYLNRNNNLNSCIAIRTISIENNQLTIQSGAGIVYDSKPEDEYKETINKATALFNALSQLYKGETLYDFDN